MTRIKVPSVSLAGGQCWHQQDSQTLDDSNAPSTLTPTVRGHRPGNPEPALDRPPPATQETRQGTWAAAGHHLHLQFSTSTDLTRPGHPVSANVQSSHGDKIEHRQERVDGNNPTTMMITCHRRQDTSGSAADRFITRTSDEKRSRHSAYYICPVERAAEENSRGDGAIDDEATSRPMTIGVGKSLAWGAWLAAQPMLQTRDHRWFRHANLNKV